MLVITITLLHVNRLNRTPVQPRTAENDDQLKQTLSKRSRPNYTDSSAMHCVTNIARCSQDIFKLELESVITFNFKSHINADGLLRVTL